MLKSFNANSLKVVQNVDIAISVMRNAGKWLLKSGKKPSKWWRPKNLNRKFLFRYTRQREFYAVLIKGKPAASAVLQINQNAQDWKTVDGVKPQSALYIHWLCVHRRFAGTGLPKVMIDFAAKLAEDNNVSLLRADTNAAEMKLRNIYEALGFKLVAIEQENYRRTAFYQKQIN